MVVRLEQNVGWVRSEKINSKYEEFFLEVGLWRERERGEERNLREMRNFLLFFKKINIEEI